MEKTNTIQGQEFFRETSGMPVWIRIMVTISTIMPAFILLLVNKTRTKELVAILIVEVSILLIANLLFMNMKLDLVVTSAGVFFKMKPFHPRYRWIKRDEISSAALQKDNILGYGMKRKSLHDRAIKMSDGPGLKLILNDGKTWFFSTHKPEAMQGAIALFRSDGSHYAKSY